MRLGLDLLLACRHYAHSHPPSARALAAVLAFLARAMRRGACGLTGAAVIGGVSRALGAALRFGMTTRPGLAGLVTSKGTDPALRDALRRLLPAVFAVQ